MPHMLNCIILIEGVWCTSFKLLTHKLSSIVTAHVFHIAKRGNISLKLLHCFYSITFLFEKVDLVTICKIIDKILCIFKTICCHWLYRTSQMAKDTLQRHFALLFGIASGLAHFPLNIYDTFMLTTRNIHTLYYTS